MPEPKQSIDECLTRGQAAADHAIDAAHVKVTYDGAAANAALDAKVKRWRAKKRSRVEDWKERLALRVLNETPDQHHEDLIDAMLELAVDTKLRQLGVETATETIYCVIEWRGKELRGKLN
jgi:hypothetical protein